MSEHAPLANQDTDSKRYVLAIDLGSGGPKAAIVADSGEVIASAEENITTHMLPNGGAEQDPQEWWNGAKKTSCGDPGIQRVTAGRRGRRLRFSMVGRRPGK